MGLPEFFFNYGISLNSIVNFNDFLTMTNKYIINLTLTNTTSVYVFGIGVFPQLLETFAHVGFCLS